MRRMVVFLPAIVFATNIAMASTSRAIRSVSVDHGSLNVSAGDILTVKIDLGRPGRLSILLLDRDGFPVRTLAKDQSAKSSFAVTWDGRDDAGEFVADEAYSLKVDWHGTGVAETYFPANTPQPMTAVPVRSYSRRSATLTYSLSQPSRVHVQAGTSTIDPATKQAAGAVMKTVVNREPRIAGTIAEHWSGFDESGLVFVPDLPDFVVAIAASPLPENSIITFGNRKRQFLETLANRHGTSLFTKRARGEHHTGLQTADDVSPGLVIAPLNAAWSAADRAWIAEPGVPLRLKLSVEGPTAATFQTHPATVEVFVDGKRIGGQQEKRTDIVEVPSLANGAVRRVSINWNSDWGPVAANTIQVLARDQASAPGAVK